MNDVALRMDIEDGANTTVLELVQAVVSEDELRIPQVTSTIFTLWMTSGLLGTYIRQRTAYN